LFTGGITRLQRSNVLGVPVTTDAVDAGELARLEAEVLDGVCPNCGVEGKRTKRTHEPHPMDGDPYQDVHDAVHARVQDPDDPLVREQAQAVVRAMVQHG
jgi:hypothetical protein